MASKTRSADAVWTGAGKDGSGILNTESGAVSNVSYSSGMRFADEQGTNPEELIGAAHAGCFNMALAFQLAGAGHAPEELRTTARVSIVQETGGWRIDAIELDLKGRVPGISADEFKSIAEKAKAGCPVSKALNANITLKAELA